MGTSSKVGKSKEEQETKKRGCQSLCGTFPQQMTKPNSANAVAASWTATTNATASKNNQ